MLRIEKEIKELDTKLQELYRREKAIINVRVPTFKEREQMETEQTKTMNELSKLKQLMEEVQDNE